MDGQLFQLERFVTNTSNGTVESRTIDERDRHVHHTATSPIVQAERAEVAKMIRERQEAERAALQEWKRRPR